MTTRKKCVTCNFVVLLRETSTNSLLKKMFLEIFDDQLPFFKVKYDFNGFCYSKCLDFNNLYTLFTSTKRSGVFRTKQSSQACQDDCMFLSCHVSVSEWIHTLQLHKYQRTPCSKQAQNLKFKWLQRDLNSKPISS